MLYFCDYNGTVFKLDFTQNILRQKLVSREHEKQQSIAFMEQDDEYLYCVEYGNSLFRVYEKESNEKRFIDVGLLTNTLKLFQDYIVLMDTTFMYIVEKKTFQIIATYNVNGSVEAICPRGKNSKELIGITQKGEIFIIHLELKDQNLRQFCKNERVLAISTSTHERKNPLDEQDMFFFDINAQLFKLNYKEGYFRS